MTRQRTSPKSNPPGLLERLSPQEAVAVLRQLLDQHPELCLEAEQFAMQLVTSVSIETIAGEVSDRITGIGVEGLEGRAGKHSWGYVEPGEAAMQLMDESIQDLEDDMKRKAELGLVPAAQIVCAGIVQGLYQAQDADTDSEGALGWAPEFPAEHAGFVVKEFLEACSPAVRKGTKKSLMAILAKCAPKWVEGLKGAA